MENYDMKQTQTAPLLWVPGTLLLPETTLKLKNLKHAQAESLLGDTFVIVPASKAESRRKDDESQETAEPVLYGLCAKGASLHQEDGEWALTVHLSERVRIIAREEDGSACAYEAAPEENDLDEAATREMLGYIKNFVRETVSEWTKDFAITWHLDRYDNLNQLLTFLAQTMPLSQNEMQELLALSSMKERATRFIDYLLRFKQMISLNLEMKEKFSRQNEAYYRKQALQRQLEAIQDELGEEDEDKDENDFAARIQALPVSDEVRKSLLEDARRLEGSNPQGSEYEVLRNYLEFALSLPWKKEEVFEPDLQKAREILDARHTGLDKVKERIIEHLAVMKLRKSSRGSALLLVGPPGTGKTSLGKSIAEALHRPYTRISLGGIRDESEIRGHRRTYVGAMAGRILKTMKSAGATNPVMILDEMDKMMQGGFSGDPAAAMLEVLDPEQNDSFTDHYLDLPYDLSDVMFIGTANSLEGIPAPLLDRMEVIQVSSYTPNEKFHIAKDHLIGEVLADHGIDPSMFTIEDEAIRGLIDGYTMEGGCRGLKKKIAALARAKAVDLAEKNEPVVISGNDLEVLLGAPSARHEKAKRSNPYGVVTGLAWTAVGGEVLFIEAASMPGSGQMILTGQLGDVMKESARISLSVLKSRMPLDAMAFKEQDIHIHFPAGATPKDGPSAGITILCALASLALHKPISSRLAMTGELSLSGEVLPIGGLREKLSGALRAGIEKVLIPYDNQSDLKEVPEEVLNALEIVPVRTASEVLKEALDLSLPAIEQSRLAAIPCGSVQASSNLNNQ